MQLVKNKNLIPLSISAGLLLSSFAYSDIDQYSSITSVLSNDKVAKYVQIVDNKSDNEIIIRSKFYNYYNSWVNQTRFLSSSKAITSQPDFLRIVNLGYEAVPFILEIISRKPSTLVWALNIIFQEKISNNPNLTISDACKLWVKRLS